MRDHIDNSPDPRDVIESALILCGVPYATDVADTLMRALATRCAEYVKRRLPDGAKSMLMMGWYDDDQEWRFGGLELTEVDDE